MPTETHDPVEVQLLSENDEYRKLYEAHIKYKVQVEQFAQKKYLTPEEEYELKQIKKLKLAGKDRMTRILLQAKEI